MNLPEEELKDAVRVFMHIEQAHWFYEDFYVDNHKHLQSMKLKDFAQTIFEQSAVLSPIQDQCVQYFTLFKNYRHKIPVYGAIMLNESLDKMLLVRSWKGNSWTFPRGKINEDEEEAACAAREVYEETGYLPKIDPKVHARLEANDHGKQVILFVVPGVVENQDFAPRARKEVSKIGWFPLNAVPKGHYNVMPFMGRLKKIAANLRKKARKAKNGKHTLKVPQTVSKKQCSNLSPNARQQLDTSTKASKKRKGRKQPKHSQERSDFGTEDTYDFDESNSETFDNALGGGVKGGSKQGWGIEDMFAANSKLTGLKYTYDGNPHSFGNETEKAVRVGIDTQKSLWRAQGNEHVTATTSQLLTPSVAALFENAKHSAGAKAEAQSCAAAATPPFGCSWKGGLLIPMTAN
jgi:mRNA-decapping enzyme subunit 2